MKTAGEQPPPRANHASAVDEFRLYIFGGWDAWIGLVMCGDFPDFTIKNCDLTMGFHSTDWFVGENLQETIGFSHEDHGVFLQIFPQTNPLMDGRMGGCGVLRAFLGKVDIWLFWLGCEAQIGVEFLADFGGKQKFGRVLD